MTLSTVGTLVLIAIVAVISPLLAELSGRLAIPGVVFEIALGIVIGPAVLGIAHTGSIIDALEGMGLAFLMFLAGLELDLGRIRGRSLELATAGWGISLALALLIAGVLAAIGTVIDAIVIGLALTTTAFGTLLPILRDADLAEGRFGARIMAIGSVGEFAPIVTIAVLLDRRNPGATSLLLVGFVAVAVAAAMMAARHQPPALVRFLHRHVHSSAQLPVRVSMLLIIGLVFLAFRFGLDVLLGAFAAGIVVKLFIRGEDSTVVRGKLEGIGFGFLVPIFFIVSGMLFDLHALFATPTGLLRVPLFLVLFLVVRGAPVLLLHRRDLPRYQRAPLALFASTGLPLIVVITTIGVEEGRMRPVNAAALVTAGMLSVLVYPMIARALLRRAPEMRPGEADPAIKGGESRPAIPA